MSVPSAVVSDERARTFAREWIETWNSHDLDRILSHYSDDVVVTSPFIARMVEDGHGAVHGKHALREYWTTALTRYPELHFVPYNACGGVDSVVLFYRSINQLDAMEFMRFDEHGLVCEVVAHYAPAATAPATVPSPALPETYRGFVYPWELDQNAHLNVHFYVKRFDEATWQFSAMLGITQRYLREANRQMVAREQHIEHQAEVFAATLLVIRTRLIEVRERSVQFEHAMFNVETGELVATSRLIGVHIDATTRAPTALPGDVKTRCRELIPVHAAAATR
jgi:acyl-CoA thioester hydrolase